MKGVLLLLIFLVLILVIFGIKSQKSEFDREVEKIVRFEKFSIFSWELKNGWIKLWPKVSLQNLTSKEKKALVLKYFLDKDPILEDVVEQILREQIEEVLKKEKISSPFGFLKDRVFPPLWFEIEKPPKILVISPREKIEIKKWVFLSPQLDDQKRDQIEKKIDQLSVSSLIVEIGGVATFPALIKKDVSLKGALEGICHEWLHHYLFFKPLGQNFKKSYQLRIINETVANLLGKEIGALVFSKYYSDFPKSPQLPTPKTDFDFNQEMRKIREKVDLLLSQGKISEAEEFMKERRDFLAKKGHYLRKLNQAYFAFHGTYADLPSSIDPLGEKLRTIREKTESIREFLDQVSKIKDPQDLDQILKDLEKEED